MKIHVEISQTDLKALEHYVEDAKAWVENAVAEKVAACKKRLARQEIDRALAENDTIPPTLDDIIEQIFTAPTYKNRKARNEEQKTKEPQDGSAPRPSV